MKKILKSLTVCIVTGALGACGGQSQYPIRILYQSQQCAQPEQDLRVLKNERALASLGRPLQLNAASPKVEVDWEKEWAVLVAWGQKTHAGYQIATVGNHAEPAGDTLVLPVRFEAPAPDAMQAQVMTSPCVLLAVPKGGYRHIQADGLSLRLPE